MPLRYNVSRDNSIRKFPLWRLLCFLLLTGCSDAHKEEQEGTRNCESYVDAALNNKDSESKIVSFDYKLPVFKQKDSSYQYEITISNPRTAMYNTQVIAVDPALDSNSSVYPCLELLGGDAETSFNMIPYQVSGARNFVSKISLDDTSECGQLTLQVMVTWKDSKLVNTGHAFFTCNYTQKDNEANG